MTKDIIARIKDVITWTELSQRQFSIKVDFAYTTLNSYLRFERESIDAELLYKILDSFQSINAEWLLTGRGEMLKTSENASIVQENETEYIAETHKIYSSSEYRKQITKLIEQHDSLIEIIKTQTELLKNKLTSNNQGAHLGDTAEDADASGF